MKLTQMLPSHQLSGPPGQKNCQKSEGAHDHPVGVVAKGFNDIHTGFGTGNMGHAKTHGVVAHICTHLAFVCPTQGKGIGERKGKHFTKSQKQDIHHKDTYPDIN